MKDIFRFKKNFERLAKMFDLQRLTVFYVDEYFEVLKKFPDDAVEEGINLTIKEWKPCYGKTFPAPAEIAEFVLQVRKQQIQQATIYKAPKEQDIKHTEKGRKMLNLLKDFGNKKINLKELKDKMQHFHKGEN